MISYTLVIVSMVPLADAPASDLKRFGQYGPFAKAEANFRLTSEFITFFSRNRALRKVRGWPDQLLDDAEKAWECYSRLREALRPGATEPEVRYALTAIRNVLSKEEYRDGKVPPPVPPVCEKEFEKWRKEQPKAKALKVKG